MTALGVVRGGARSVALALASLALVAGLVRAEGQRVTLGASLSSSYDSNVLEYSSAQIALFESGSRPDRYSLETSDDLGWDPGVSLGWELAGPNGRRHALRMSASGNFHQRNGTADFHAASAGWRETWSQERRLSASWYRLPDYYLRQLLDEDLPSTPGVSRYRRASFALDIASLDWTQRIGRRNTLALETQYERRRYNADFRERDSNTGQGQVAWGWTRLPGHGRLELRALYRRSDAKAEDGDPVPGSAPDDQDVSYHGLGGGVRGEIDLARGGSWRYGGDADYQYAVREFDSDRAFDTFHFGREDRLHTIELGVSARWQHALRIRAFWHFERNAAQLGAPAASLSTDTGDYSRSQVGLRLDWSGTVWRSNAADAAGEE